MLRSALATWVPRLRRRELPRVDDRERPGVKPRRAKTAAQLFRRRALAAGNDCQPLATIASGGQRLPGAGGGGRAPARLATPPASARGARGGPESPGARR